MAADEAREDKTSSPTEYSATKAPENRPHVESTAAVNPATLRPGGATGSPVAIGISAVDRVDIPSGARKPEELAYGENPAAERAGTGKE